MGSPSTRLCLVLLLPFLESFWRVVRFHLLGFYRRSNQLLQARFAIPPPPHDSPAPPAPLPSALLAAKFVFLRGWSFVHLYFYVTKSELIILLGENFFK